MQILGSMGWAISGVIGLQQRVGPMGLIRECVPKSPSRLSKMLS